MHIIAQTKYTNKMQGFKFCFVWSFEKHPLLRGKDCLKVEQGHGDQMEIQSLEQEVTALTVAFCPTVFGSNLMDC